MYESILLFWLDRQINSDADKQNLNFFNQNISSIESVIKEDKKINWKSWLIIDTKSSIVLWKKEADKQLAIASLTKIMTAILIIENHKLEEKVTISKNAVYTEGSKIYMLPWEVFSVWDLLNWLLIKSWNDVAVALAEYHSWNVEDFVKEMNIRAEELWLKNTQFKNPTGLDEKWHFSSAQDLWYLSTFILKNEYIKEVVKKKMWIIKSTKWRVVKFFSTNKLLWNWVIGLKTGTTDNAGQCLITLIKKDNKELLFILLWSTNRFDTTEDLIKFIFSKIN